MKMLSAIFIMVMGLVLIPLLTNCSVINGVFTDKDSGGSINLKGDDANGVFTDKDNGDSINLKVNDAFQVKLESNITTGYSWSPAKDTNFEILAIASSEYVQSSKNMGMPGSGGYEVFIFNAVKKGQTELVLEYQRPWEDEVEPVNTFKISVTVE